MPVSGILIWWTWGGDPESSHLTSSTSDSEVGGVMAQHVRETLRKTGWRSQGPGCERLVGQPDEVSLRSEEHTSELQSR